MREIKFRAWDKVNEEWVSHSDLVDVKRSKGRFLELIISPDTVLMQYTGLHDKNGKEIYEGDILRLDRDWQGPSSNGVKVGAVEFRDCSFCLELFDSLPLHLLIPSVVEVIGNIYENPELLSV